MIATSVNFSGTLPRSYPVFAGSAEKPPVPHIDPEALPKEDPKPKKSHLTMAAGILSFFLSAPAGYYGVKSAMTSAISPPSVSAEVVPKPQGQEPLGAAESLLAEAHAKSPAKRLPEITEASRRNEQKHHAMAEAHERGPIYVMSVWLGGSFLMAWLVLNGMFSSLVLMMMGAQPRMTPETFWKELHRLGGRGRGLRIAFVDSGLRPTRHLKSNRFQVFEIDDPKQPIRPYDPKGHGTQVASIAGRSLPQAEFSMLKVGVASNDHTVRARLAQKRYQSFIEHPETLTLEALIDRAFGFEFFEDETQEIRTALQTNPDVISISLGLSLADVVSRLTLGLKTTHPGDPEKIEQVTAQWEQIFAAMTLEDLERVLKPRLKPVIEALDEAAQAGVPVVVSAGNEGMRPRNRLDGYAWSPWKLVQHPALLVVGSARSDGQVSEFTSEGTQTYQPGIAGYGDGELVGPADSWRQIYRAYQGLDPSAPEKKLIRLLPLLLGLAKFKSKLSSGTSIATPDIATTLAMMKQVDPGIFKPGEPLKEALAILAQTARPCHLSPKDLKKLQERYPDQELTQEMIQQHIRRRVGPGLVHHNRAVAETLRRRLQRLSAESKPEQAGVV